MPLDTTLVRAADCFIENETIDRVAGTIRSGKEAVVFKTEKSTPAGPAFGALKVYRPTTHRSFRNDQCYRHGRPIDDTRLRRAVARGTRRGRTYAFGMWVHHEAECLRVLRERGADVPAVIDANGSAVLMELIGDAGVPAPTLREVDLEQVEACGAFEQIVRNLQVFLEADIIHADLSPYNILYQRGKVTIIDLPQAVDARANDNAADLLVRDVTRVCAFFGGIGVECDVGAVLRRLRPAMPPPLAEMLVD